MTTYELIQGARRRIAGQRTVPRGQYWNVKTGEYCAVGAIQREAIGAEYPDWRSVGIDAAPPLVYAAIKELIDTLNIDGVPGESAIFFVNDWSGREGVLEMFDKWLADNAPETPVEVEQEELVAA